MKSIGKIIFVTGTVLAQTVSSTPAPAQAVQSPFALQTATVADPPNRIRADGISAIPPAGSDWIEDTSIVRCQRPGPLRPIMVFRTRVQPPQSIVASVTRRELSPDIASRIHSGTEREKLLYQLRNESRSDWDSGRYRAISFAANIDHSLGSDCLRVDLRSEDRGVPGHAGEVFELEQHAYHCVAPDSRSVVIIEYSQRAPKGSSRYDLGSDGEAFLKSLRFAAAGEPAGPGRALNDRVAFTIDNYALHLRDSGNSAKATEIASQAARLREAERQMCAGAASVSLGFTPDKTLQEYAGFLRAKGLMAEAAETDALAKKYHDNQIQAYIEQVIRQQRQPPK